MRASRIEAITKDQFQLPTLAPFLEDVQRELVDGRGFALLKGLPVHRYSTRYWSPPGVDMYRHMSYRPRESADTVLCGPAQPGGVVLRETNTRWEGPSVCFDVLL